MRTVTVEELEGLARRLGDLKYDLAAANTDGGHLNAAWDSLSDAAGYLILAIEQKKSIISDATRDARRTDQDLKRGDRAMEDE